jgi:hypothetical protein
MDCTVKPRRKASRVKTPASYRLVRKRVSSLKPSPENCQLYKAVAPDDPEIVQLAKSIKRDGLHEPLIVTADNYVVSGHRRLCALKLINQQFAACRVRPEKRADMTTDEYVALLRDCNRQRNKSVAEQVREELVDIDPEAAVRNLRVRRELSRNGYQYSEDVEVLDVEGQSRRWRISDQKAEHVQHISQVIYKDRRSFWPLSVRAVHYALLNYQFWRNTKQQLQYQNDRHSYQATSNLITRLRIAGSIPWEAIRDETRPCQEFRAFSDVRHFVRQECDRLFVGYWRDLLQTQPNYVECLVEKNTVHHMALRATEQYQIPTTSGRGFSSIDLWHEVYVRFRASRKHKLILIVLSDYDPEGELIPHVGGRILRDDFHLSNVEIIKAGVTRQQIERYELAPQNFAKESSSNFDWFTERNGGDNTVYELEALEPSTMISDLESVIIGVLDMDLFNAELAVEESEATYLQAAQRKATEALKGLGE